MRIDFIGTGLHTRNYGPALLLLFWPPACPRAKGAGGYQVADKWLKDRKGRTLSSDEVAHYCRVVTALAETIKIQAGLDELFEDVEKNALEITETKR